MYDILYVVNIDKVICFWGQFRDTDRAEHLYSIENLMSEGRRERELNVFVFFFSTTLFTTIKVMVIFSNDWLKKSKFNFKSIVRCQLVIIINVYNVVHHASLYSFFPFRYATTQPPPKATLASTCSQTSIWTTYKHSRTVAVRHSTTTTMPTLCLVPALVEAAVHPRHPSPNRSLLGAVR